MESMIIGDHDQYPPKDSFEEVVDPKPVERSYECIFCKRGFTTAQALGGHMNIHRKDRAIKSKRNNNFSSNNNNSSTQIEDHSCYASPRFYQPIFTNYPQITNISEVPKNQECYTTYFASTSSSSTSLPRNYENNHQDFGTITSPSRDEKMMSLSLQFGRSVDEDKDSKRCIRDDNQDEELDLELRLGQ